MMRFPALLALLALCLLWALGCTDKPVVERPRLDSIPADVPVDVPPDSAGLDSLLDTTAPRDPLLNRAV